MKSKQAYVSHRQAYPMLSFIRHVLQPKPRIRPSPLSHSLLTACTNSICIHIQTAISFMHTNSTHDSMMTCDEDDKQPYVSHHQVYPILCYPSYLIYCNQSLVLVPRLYHIHYLRPATTAYISTSRPTCHSFTPTAHMTV